MEAPPRACVNCVRAKAKCVAGTGPGSKCHRCQRLARVCEPSVPQVRTHPEKRKRTTSTRRISRSHVEKLEEKLDGLVTLLKSTHDIGSGDEASNLSSGTSRLRSATLPDQDAIASSLSPGELNGSTRTQSTSHDLGYTADFCTPTSSVSILPPTAFNGLEWELSKMLPPTDDANGLLEIFKDQACLYFPFISVPKSTSAEDLRRERPFLYLAIMAVTSQKSYQKEELGKLLLRQIAERVFVDGERSLDLLLGILTFTAWSHFHVYKPHQLTSVMGAALILISDLGLHRSGTNEPPVFFEEPVNQTGCHVYRTKATKSLDEKRAVLAYFSISSHSSFSSLKSQTLQFNPYIEEYRQSLVESEDHHNDKNAAAMVKLQTILERMGHSSWHVKSDAFRVSPPIVLIVNAIEEQLKQFKKEFSPQLENNKAILMHYYSVEIVLYQVGLSRPAGTHEKHDFKQVELLYACLKATKSLWDIFLSIPTESFDSFSLLTWGHIRTAMLSLYQVSVFDDPEWSLAYVRETIDFLWAIDRLIERLDIAAVNSGIFARASMKMSQARARCAKKMATQPQAGAQEHRDPNFFDDIWFRDMFEFADYQIDTPIAQ